MCPQWYGYELCLLELVFCCLTGDGSGWSLMYDIYSKNPCDFKKNGRSVARVCSESQNDMEWLLRIYLMVAT